MVLRALLSGTTFLLPAFAHAQTAPPTDDEDLYDEVIIVTASRISASSLSVTQSGAQDINDFRDTIEEGELPPPGAIRSEGLLSEYDLPLSGPNDAPCAQLFCLSLAAMDADLPLRPEADLFLGLGFQTGLTTETWQREPMTLVAVVDTSGSMGGEPLETARASLQFLKDHLRPDDRLAVVRYSDAVEVVHAPARIDTHSDSLSRAIAGLESNGSTNMEEGLELAYATAFAAQAGWDGQSRVLLFTDEQPNVGDTDAESFLGMARAAAARDVGLTTFGVSDNFGGDIANEIAEAEGGNLFYLADVTAAEKLFANDIDLLLTEVARDLQIEVTPAPGLKIAEVYGLPGEAFEISRKGALKMTVPSVFLSSNAGGIFLTLDGAPKGDGPLATTKARYDNRLEGRLEHHSSTLSTVSAPSDALRKAHRLTDEFTALLTATEAGVFGTDKAMALTAAEDFLTRIEDDLDLDREVELIEGLIEVLEDPESTDQSRVANNSYEFEKIAETGLLGAWEIARVRNQSSFGVARDQIDLRRGDRIAFHLNTAGYDETLTFNAKRMKPRGDELPLEVESILHRPEKREVELPTSDIIFRYQARKDGSLRLFVEDSDLVLTLVPTGRTAMTAEG